MNNDELIERVAAIIAPFADYGNEAYEEITNDDYYCANYWASLDDETTEECKRAAVRIIAAVRRWTHEPKDEVGNNGHSKQGV